jgi:hypothetical protein
MKRILTGLIFLWLFLYFLVYAGVFRNNNDPVKVARFYFECMKNYEWMLTYPVTKPGCFDDIKIVSGKERIFDKAKINRMDFTLLGIKEGIAFVEAELVCEDLRVIKSKVILEKNNQNKWLIKEVSYT